MKKTHGYHSREIAKGVLGQKSKIREEFEEFEDALEQENPVMALVELSDLIGAVEAYALTYGVSLENLITMKDATARAFASGKRK